MRWFELLALEHIALYLFPTLAFVILFALFAGYTHWRTPDAEERKTRIIERFADGIEGRDAPFPLAMTITIAGTIVWGLLYIWFSGTLGVKI